MSNVFWSIITLLGLAGWLASAIVFIFKAFPERGLFNARPALLWGSVLLASYAVWVVGMLNS